MPRPSPFTGTRARWTALLALSVVLAAALDHVGLPAGRLLGTMLAAIALAVLGHEVRVPRVGFLAAQGVIGCLIARGVPPTVVPTMAQHWPAFLAGVVSVTILANVLGWLLSRWQVFPGDTAIWGSAPGAASAMMLMAEAHGADIRLVAFMQYVRIVCVTVAASLVAHWWGISPGAAPPAAAPAGHWLATAATLALALGGAAVGARSRVPAGALLVPMVAGILLQDVAGFQLELPAAVLTPAYALVGWSIGMRFNREVLVTTVRSLPEVLAATLALIVLCGALAAALVRWANVDPLTAYLATSPGGADSIAIIAAATPVDVPFVVTMQMLRMMFVMVTGPAIARALARRVRRRPHET